MEHSELLTRESVRQTLADYTAATDGFDLAALASCFTEDGRLEYTGGGTALVGRDQIESGLRAQLSGASPGPKPTHVRHHVSSIRIFGLEPDKAEASSYFVVFTDIGVDHWGRYRDVLHRAGTRWLIASRKIKVDGFAADSLMNNASR